MLLIDAIAHVETHHRFPAQTGDHGKALSIFQIHECVWSDVHQRFPNVDIGKTFSDIGHDDPVSVARARCVALLHEDWLRQEFKRYNVNPTPPNLYAAWNLGFTGFKLRHFNLAECPLRVIDRAQLVHEALSHEPPAKSPRHD